jgi:hypothetical protein
MNILLIFIILITIYLLIFENNVYEGLNQFTSTEIKDNIIDGTNLLDDKLFQSVVVYDNILDGNEVKQLGFIRCLDRCVGKCIEFGNMGQGLCFRDDENGQINIDEILKNNAYTHKGLYSKQ